MGQAQFFLIVESEEFELEATTVIGAQVEAIKTIYTPEDLLVNDYLIMKLGEVSEHLEVSGLSESDILKLGPERTDTLKLGTERTDTLKLNSSDILTIFAPPVFYDHLSSIECNIGDYGDQNITKWDWILCEQPYILCF